MLTFENHLHGKARGIVPQRLLKRVQGRHYPSEHRIQTTKSDITLLMNLGDQIFIRAGLEE